MDWAKAFVFKTDDGAEYRLTDADCRGYRNVSAKGVERLGEFPKARMKLLGSGNSAPPRVDHHGEIILGTEVIFKLEGRATFWTTFPVTEIRIL